MPLLHHLSLSVSDLARSGRLYDAALGALGYARLWSSDNAIGYGSAGGDDQFAIKHRSSRVVTPSAGFHLAFAAPTRAAVDAFYEAAIAHGAKDNGGPGLRPHYGLSYYAAFVMDLDDYAIEAVTTA